MDKIELKVTFRDWLFIIIIGAFFGLLISLLLYLVNPQLQYLSTIVFSVLTAIKIALFSSVLITLSNNYILPKVNDSFWYAISFLFSFIAGFLGFTVSYFVGRSSDLPIAIMLEDWWVWIATTMGFLTFLIGLILHQFIAMKYKHEQGRNQIITNRLQALENELNPHFLFNALNSMSELVYLDQQKAERSILNLATFLRNAINKESLIPLDLELEMVRTYVEIENIRFNNQIQLSIEIDPLMDKVVIPKFSIQLLVENAIKHGYQKKPLTIQIDCTHHHISVTNNGKITTVIHYGTGLQNLQDRLGILEVGHLSHRVEDTTMTFTINLKEQR
ncbi:MAG TPA: histidine kinase [Campylobacterales bacterium]|nr:histidine kinase [Campylobacterales bacterium]